jgi:hypothetical protein
LSKWYVLERHFYSFTDRSEVQGKTINFIVDRPIILRRVPIAIALVCTSGWMETKENEYAIFKPLVGAKEFKKKMLQTWTTAEDREEHELGEGLNIIGPCLKYSWPCEVPFIPLFAHSD